MKKMTPEDIEGWREDCRTGRNIVVPSSEFRVFLDAWEEREALKKTLRRLQLDGQRATVCPDCASEDEELGAAFRLSDFGVLGGQGADSTCDLCGGQKGGREVVVPGKLATALAWNKDLETKLAESREMVHADNTCYTNMLRAEDRALGLETKLAAANEAVIAAEDRAWTELMWNKDLETKLATAQEEIERLNKANVDRLKLLCPTYAFLMENRDKIINELRHYPVLITLKGGMRKLLLSVEDLDALIAECAAEPSAKEV